MQPVKLVKASIQFGFGNHRNIFIFFVARFVVHQPHHAAPEPVRPPIDPVRQRAGGIRGGTIVMRPVYRCVRDLKPRFFAYPSHLGRDLRNQGVHPLLLVVT